MSSPSIYVAKDGQATAFVLGSSYGVYKPDY